MKISITSEAQLDAAGRQLLDAFPHARTFAFHGEMGAGKTTFIKAICRCLGVTEIMSSPTFSIVNEYQSASGETIYHFDFYRIENESEAYNAGLHEYFDSGRYCLVEWPEKVPSILPEGTVHVMISVQENTRVITA